MRALAVRQRVAQAAAVAASVALVAACAPAKPSDSTGNGALGSAAGYAPGTLVVSDGTKVVRIGEAKVAFQVPVTDAVLSPDGSRIAFVNGEGNIATARLDGSSMRVLTKAVAGVVRSRPAWFNGQLLFGEVTAGKSLVRSVWANGVSLDSNATETDAFLGEREDASGEDQSQPGQAVTAAAVTGGGRELAFQRAGAKGPEVWVADLNQREPFQSKLVDGSEPALSPDGSKVAYVDTAGQVQVLSVAGQDQKPIRITFGVAAPSHLTWTPDNSRLAFATASDIESVAIAVPAGATGNPTTQLSPATGVPSFLPPSRDQVVRIAGAGPVDLSVAASQASWPSQSTFTFSQSRNLADAAILTGATNLPTILAGAQMVDGGPLLFNSGSTLDNRTKAELVRVFGTASPPDNAPTVTILGGTDVVSTGTESAVKALGYLTTRTSAADPYAMAVAAAGKPANATRVFVVDAADTASYVATISSLGRYSDQTVLLTNGATLPDGVKTFLNGIGKGIKVYAVGANARTALATSWAGKPALSVTAVTGPTPAAVAGLVVSSFGSSVSRVVVVDASATTDVIAAIGLARKYGAPVLAVDPRAGLDEGLKAWLDATSGSLDTVMIVDPKGAIGADLEHTISALVAGPLGVTTANNPKVAG